MPTEEELAAQAVKRAQLSGKSSGGLSTLVIPQIPYRPLPPTTAKRDPALDQWNRDNHAALAQWREQANAVLVRETPATETP